MTTTRIAVLIDGDNAESALIEQILAEAGKNGKLRLREFTAIGQIIE